MAFSIKNSDTDRLTRQLAAATGESLTEAVTKAVRERLERVRPKRRGKSLADRLDAIARRCAAAPELDPRSADEIIGYDEHGLPQ